MDEPRTASRSSATALLLTVLGELVLPRGGAAWTSTLVAGLGLLGVEQRNARQAIARLADAGTVRSEKRGRRARWHLTDAGRRLLVDGTARIYGLADDGARWDGRWLVVLCSVPEHQRAKRHQLRTALGFAGFGFVAPGVAVSPHVDRERAASRVLADAGLGDSALVFRAEPGDQLDAGALLQRAWDLDSLAASYERFVARFEHRRVSTDDEAFAALVELVHEWRRFPFVDPGIPAELVPTGWPGRRAGQLFHDRHDGWSSAAERWYEQAEVTASAPPAP